MVYEKGGKRRPALATTLPPHIASTSSRVSHSLLVVLRDGRIATDNQLVLGFAQVGTVPYGDHRPEFGGGNGKNALPGVVFCT